MVGEWREVRFGEVAEILPGKYIPASDYDPAGAYVVYGSNSIMGRVHIPLYEGPIIAFARIGSNCGATMYSAAPCWINNNAAGIRAKAGCDTRFIYYWMQSCDFSQIREGSGQPYISDRALKELVLLLPPVPEQRAIAHILGTLDDKIELNRRMSETLEAMARALFKAWFVDFEPVRAKMEGRWQRGQSLPGLPAHLYDLFPDRLVDSELGEIPEGWEVGTLGQVLGELVSGARPKGGAAQEGVPSIGAENVIGLGRYDFSKEKYVPRDFFKELQRKGAAVRPGDVLLYKDGAQIGRKTYFDCGFPHEQCAVNEHVFIVRARHAHYQRYLFFWLDQDWMTQEIISLNSNSAQPGINQQGVRALPLLKPPDAVVEAFDRLSKKLTDRLFTACHESRTLAALREALLPKLIRGEIRVKDAERFLKERGL
jgi:type I restriction enzyme S subunit